MKPGSKTRNILVGIVYVVVILMVIGALAEEPDDDGSLEATGTTPTTDGGEPAAADDTTMTTTALDDTPDEPTATEEPSAPPVTSPDPIAFSGSGATVTDRFELAGGFFAAEYEHSGGSSNFIVELKDPNGEERDRLVANEIGATEGAYGDGISQGEYLMDINADGDWTVTIYQPRVAEGGGEDIPLELSGDASDDFVAVNVDGIARVHGTHEGQGNFIVESFTRNGDRHMDSLVFNEIGNFEGETTLDYDGTTWIVVEADGPWTLTFEPA